MIRIFVDADACPVKNEVCRVSQRCNIKVTFVANSIMRLPESPLNELIIVENSPDAADDLIAEQVGKNDIVVTADIPLADRCVKAGAAVLSPNGKIFSEDNMGQILASRNLMADLRAEGMITGGPPPFSKTDRSRFLQSMDLIIQRIKRENS